MIQSTTDNSDCKTEVDEEEVFEEEQPIVEESMKEETKEEEPDFKSEFDLPVVSYSYRFEEVAFLMHKMEQMLERRFKKRSIVKVEQDTVENEIEMAKESEESITNQLTSRIQCFALINERMTKYLALMLRRKIEARWRLGLTMLRATMRFGLKPELSLEDREGTRELKLIADRFSEEFQAYCRTEVAGMNRDIQDFGKSSYLPACVAEIVPSVLVESIDS